MKASTFSLLYGLGSPVIMGADSKQGPTIIASSTERDVHLASVMSVCRPHWPSSLDCSPQQSQLNYLYQRLRNSGGWGSGHRYEHNSFQEVGAPPGHAPCPQQPVLPFVAAGECCSSQTQHNHCLSHPNDGDLQPWAAACDQLTLSAEMGHGTDGRV